MPILLKRFAHANAEAPAPLITILTSPGFLLDKSNAFINAADVIIAVPC